MRNVPALLAAILALAPILDATAAHADCAAPRDYVAKVAGNQVTVCPTYGASDGRCPQAGGMLRVGLSDAGNTIEKLPDSCATPPSGTGTTATSCYVDECVPPGTYQYGFATPLDCASSCGGEYAIQVSVTTALSGCTSDAGAPTTASSVPWDPTKAAGGSVANPSCVYAGDGGGPVETPDASADGGPVETPDASAPDSGVVQPAADGGPTTDAGTARTETDGSGGGCAVVAPGSTEHTVLAVDAFALAFGLVALGRRRKRSRAK